MTTTQDSNQVTLIGADYSVYTRIVRLALQLKRVPFEFEPLDVFAGDGSAKARQAGHPFGKIPILRHGGLTLYETLAITRYIDQAFDGPPLEPGNSVERARMNQIISLVDSQAYPVLVWGLHVPKSEDCEPDPEMLQKGQLVLSVLENLAGETWLCGTIPTLADIYLTPCYAYALDSAIGAGMQTHCPRLTEWWQLASSLRQTG